MNNLIKELRFTISPRHLLVCLLVAPISVPLLAQVQEQVQEQEQEQELPRQETMVEQIVVTSALHRNRAETVLPVNVLAGDELREEVATTLGDMLENQVGVTNASFGAGAGAPVIRGQSGNRVQILQMGVGNLDASAVSPDHANSLEPALAERIEVVRGPATLLYGNGAIGGVVNVIDGRIPRTAQDELSALIETRYDSASDNRVGVVRLDGGRRQFAWHVDAVNRRSNDLEFKGFALNPDLVDRQDEEALQALLNSKGRLQNSHTESDSQTVGGSWILDDGWIGLAYNQLDNVYGLPLGAHALHDHEESDDSHEAQGADEGTSVDMEQQRWDFEARLPFYGNLFEEIHGKISHVDYRHLEVESGGEIGTVFENEGIEGRFTLHLQSQGQLEGVVGAQFSDREFSATGEEAFIGATDISSYALFTMQSLALDQVTVEVGLRAERFNMEQAGGNDNSQTNLSASAAVIWKVNDQSNLLFSINSSQRAATVDEAFSNIGVNGAALPMSALVPHAATQRIEIGLPDARQEQSTNFELGWRKYAGNVTAELNLFLNDISNYLYLFDTGEFSNDIQISDYRQEDARFKGMEFQLSLPVFETGDHLSEVTFFSDYVDARFKRSGNVARIPPWRAGVEWSHSHIDWSLKLRFAHAGAQTNHARNETKSDSYQMLSIYGDYRTSIGQSASLLLFAKGNNLLDETIRSHTSLLKDVAPAPGRGIEVGLRLEF
jgi:iron complex outermembrane receptor protein